MWATEAVLDLMTSPSCVQWWARVVRTAWPSRLAETSTTRIALATSNGAVLSAPLPRRLGVTKEVDSAVAVCAELESESYQQMLRGWVVIGRHGGQARDVLSSRGRQSPKFVPTGTLGAPPETEKPKQIKDLPGLVCLP